jgi:hypothetical protein
LTHELNEDDAKEIGDIHEAADGTASASSTMDQRNNAVGREIGKEGGGCYDGCMNALQQGRLITNPKGLPKTGTNHPLITP